MSWTKETSIHPLTAASNTVFLLSCFQKPPLQRHCQDEKDIVQPTCLENWTPVLRDNHVPDTNRRLQTGLEEVKKECEHAWSP